MDDRVEEYFYSKDEKFLELLFILRNAILNIDSRIIETIKYNIPFYIYKKNIFYLNVHKDKYIDIGFTDGFNLTNCSHNLIAGDNRNTMKSLRYYSISDLDESVLQETLVEAILYQSNTY